MIAHDLRHELYGGRTELSLPDDFVWPRGKRIAVLIGACFEGWSDDKWPGLGPMGNPLPPAVPDINAIRWAEYGGRRGMPRILRMLARYNVRATVFVSAVIAERFPQIVRSIDNDGMRMPLQDRVQVHLFEFDAAVRNHAQGNDLQVADAILGFLPAVGFYQPD